MLSIQFALIVNLIQMRRIEVIRNRKSIPNKEFQQSVELKSIEVRNSKMHTIRFALIVNLIQMRRNRVCLIREKGHLEEGESRNQTRLALDHKKTPDEWKHSGLSHSQQQFDAGNGVEFCTPLRKLSVNH
jgi:hypothetical protein